MARNRDFRPKREGDYKQQSRARQAIARAKRFIALGRVAKSSTRFPHEFLLSRARSLLQWKKPKTKTSKCGEGDFLDAQNWRAFLQSVRDGQLSVDNALLQALRQIEPLPPANAEFEELGFAKVDHARAARQGFPEVIFCLGKTPAQVAPIAQSLHARGSTLLATRATREVFDAVSRVVPTAKYHEIARIVSADGEIAPHLDGRIGVLAAGTSDLPVAEEAVVTLETMGANVHRIYDVGVAGLHRLLHFQSELRGCDALIVCAGMEGALPSVVAGLVDIPVIAVPTSVGYGASFGGLAALLGMLNSCANGVAVVNIDNGFGAAAFASSILRTKD